MNRSLLPLLLLAAFTASAQTYEISKFGAKADRKTVNTRFIQDAIDAAARAGGGTVEITPGTFMSGAIFLKSHTHLHVQAGAVLKGVRPLADYTVNGSVWGLVNADDQEDLALTGEGEINGNADAFMDRNRREDFVDYDPKFTRQGKEFMHNYEGIGDGPIKPVERTGMMVWLRHCSDVRLRGLRLTAAGNWTLRISECENVIVTGLTILNDRLIPNNDGIHCPTSRNVVISDCNIIAGDDGIVVTGFGDEASVNGYNLKTTDRKYRFGNKTNLAENIVVSNCVIESSSAGIRIGYGKNSIRTCRFENLIIHESNRGILIQCRDASSIEHISFDHITITTKLITGPWWGKAEPISISTAPVKDVPKPGIVRDIHFSEINVPHAEAGVVIYGFDPASMVEDVTIDRLRITLGNGPQTETFGGNIELRPTSRMDLAEFSHEIPAVFAHGVKNLTLTNLDVRWETSHANFFSYGSQAEQFDGLVIEKFSGVSARPDLPKIKLDAGSRTRTDHSVE